MPRLYSAARRGAPREVAGRARSPSIESRCRRGRPPWTLLAGLPRRRLSPSIGRARPGRLGSGPRRRRSGRRACSRSSPRCVFAGGFAALRDAQRWLDAHRARARRTGRSCSARSTTSSASSSRDGPRSRPHGTRRLTRSARRIPRGLSLRRAHAARPRWSAARAPRSIDSRSGSPARRGERKRRRRRCPRPAARRTPTPEYARAVERVKAYIRAGDVYQVNLSRRLEARGAGRGRAASALRRARAARGRALLRLSGEARRDRPLGFARVLPARRGRPRRDLPDQGHAAARRDARGGRAAAQGARELAKDRAEHVMIVDLERNDLGRVCETGSVRVTRLCEPRAFSDVHHLVSCVEGRLRDPADWPGCSPRPSPAARSPARRSCARCRSSPSSSRSPRGVYTGALGRIDSDGRRSICRSRSAPPSRATAALQLHLGGGIVADSDASCRAARDARQGPRVRAQLGLRRARARAPSDTDRASPASSADARIRAAYFA